MTLTKQEVQAEVEARERGESVIKNLSAQDDIDIELRVIFPMLNKKDQLWSFDDDHFYALEMNAEHDQSKKSMTTM